MYGKLITEHCVRSDSPTFNDAQWVELELLVIRDSIIKHFINGKEVLHYSKPVIGGQYNTLPDKTGSPLTGGYIALQSESHPVAFKDIEILPLD
jgi:hypothetical protein